MSPTKTDRAETNPRSERLFSCVVKTSVKRHSGNLVVKRKDLPASFIITIIQLNGTNKGDETKLGILDGRITKLSTNGFLYPSIDTLERRGISLEIWHSENKTLKFLIHINKGDSSEVKTLNTLYKAQIRKLRRQIRELEEKSETLSMRNLPEEEIGEVTYGAVPGTTSKLIGKNIKIDAWGYAKDRFWMLHNRKWIVATDLEDEPTRYDMHGVLRKFWERRRAFKYCTLSHCFKECSTGAPITRRDIDDYHRAFEAWQSALRQRADDDERKSSKKLRDKLNQVFDSPWWIQQP